MHRSPAVVFAGHPSLRFGEAVELLNWWKHDKKNSLILIGNFILFLFLDSRIRCISVCCQWFSSTHVALDPDYNCKDILAVHEGIKMHVNHIPIDWRLQAGSRDLDKLVQKWKPKHVILPQFLHDQCNFEAKLITKGKSDYPQPSPTTAPTNTHNNVTANQLLNLLSCFRFNRIFPTLGD